MTVVVGGLTDDILSRVRSELPAAEVFETGLEWLVGPGSENEVAISRVLLTDRTSLLVSSFYPTREGDDWTEQAVFATGLENGLVVIVRRLLSTGLLAGDDPAE